MIMAILCSIVFKKSVCFFCSVKAGFRGFLKKTTVSLIFYKLLKMGNASFRVSLLRMSLTRPQLFKEMGDLFMMSDFVTALDKKA